MRGWKPGWRGAALLLVLVLLPDCALGGLACLSNPCIHGVCIDDLNSTYSCYCIDGYTGIQCQTNWDECWSDPCQNGGTCIDGIAEYNCTCPDGYVGLNCEEDFDECDSNPCQNNGTCVDAPNGYECWCTPGFLGEHCEQDMAVCNTTEEARCVNGGQCMEGQGMSFSCRCAPGWEGKLCEIPINECNSSPCQNGGLCVDQHADFLCACSFGYTGKRCESQIELCSDNPCTNEALCMMEDTIRVCYCVPDYHGEKCQFQYDECLLGPRCMNGGTCIDGVDNFTCSCPPMLTGILCECLILEDNELDCQYVSPTTLTEELTSSFVTTPTTVEIITSSTAEYKSTTEDYVMTHEDKSSTQEISLVAEQSTVTFVPTFTWDQSTFTTLDNNYSISIGTQISTDLSTEKSFTITETAATSLETTEIELTTDLTTFDQIFTSSITSLVFLQNTTSSLFLSSDFSSTDLTKTESTFSIPLSFTHSYDLSTDMSSAKSIPSTEMSIPSTDLTSFYKTEISSESFPSITTPFYTTESSSMERTSSFEIPLSTKESTTEAITETETTVSQVIIPEITDMPTTGKEIDLSTFSHTSESTVLVDIGSTWEAKLSTTSYIPSEHSDFFTESPSLMTITMSPFESTSHSIDDSTLSSREGSDCNEMHCLNGGSCIQSSEGPKCVCKFDFDGSLCEHTLGIASAAFSGDSYLTHKLHNMTGINIQIKARTLSSEGLILYATIGQDTYMCLYMKKGLLKFKFSCGYQTMLLSELEVPVNNGYELKIKAILELTDGRKHCNASLHINETLAMSGGQVAAPTSYPPDRNSWLHLGAVSEGFGIVDHSPQDISSFTGCMLGLQIDDKPRHIFKDAVDGFEIKECSSLACLSNPCRNGGTCHDVGEQWSCRCANGYLGLECKESVCNVNPCQYGGTCVHHPGSGFMCLCPLGKHGLFCEHNLEIAQPSFSPMLGGLSSFAAYPLPTQLISHGMEMHFKIKPQNMDQISLLAFLGQTGQHDPKSDHLAVTFVKGYIMLTWNLGNGPRRIFTTRPIMSRGNRPHTIRIGRLGRTAWLSVDSMPNITGNAPGNLHQLNVLPLLYLGGHESSNFSMLPHDLPLHGGFSGCIWDLWLRGGGGGGTGMLWAPSRGRAIGQCSVTQCHPMVCHNGGACLHHAATYSCLCSDGWFGPLCSNQRNPCDFGFHNCSNGATCVPTVTGYQCDCPLGKKGLYCEQDVDLSDVSLSGIRSYLKLTSIQMGDIHFSLDFEVRPMHPKGLVFFTETHDGCFVSLSLQGGLLEYRWAGVEWGNINGGRVVVVLRSGVVLSLGAWHTVRAGRYGRRLFLWVDGTMTTETLAAHHSFTSFNTSVYIGGVKDLSTLPGDVMSAPPMFFTGCIRKIIINSQRYPLNKDHIIDSRNIDDCDGDICGGDICWNGGTCVIAKYEGQSIAECMCFPPYTGAHCIDSVPCEEGACHVGRCVKGKCVCPTGWGGHSCQNQLKMGTPHFSGNSFMVIDESKIQNSDKLNTLSKYRMKRNFDDIYINFTTAQPNGVLLWTEMGKHKYVSIGLEGGYLKLSWTFPKSNYEKSNLNSVNINENKGWPRQTFSNTVVVKMLQAGIVSNGEWHTVNLKILIKNITVLMDDKKVYEEYGSRYEPRNSDVTVFVGGFPNNVSTLDYTQGLYSSNFIGCISEVSLEPEKNAITNFSHFEGENIDICGLFS